MQKITPHLWYDKEAKEAAELYTSLFPNSKIKSVNTIHDTPAGDCDIVTFELCGQTFMSISAGPIFKFNPSISFFVCCETKEEVDKLWSVLSKDGKVMMELGKYPFSEHYGWCADRYGLSWQVMFMGGQEYKQKIIPTLMFVGDVYGKVEEAMHFYTSVFHNSSINYVHRYGKGMEPDTETNIANAGYILEGQQFAAQESARKHDFKFNEAISLMVSCKDQAEIDYYWDKLSAVPASEQCGWLKDKYGVSWQIVPENMNELMSGDPQRAARVTQAFLKMKKFDIAELEKAAEAK